MKQILINIFLITSLSVNIMAEDVNSTKKEVQNMSDPLAIYTQGGFGFTNKGLNIKIGQTYDTGSSTTAGMNIIEIKGIAGDILGWDDEEKVSNSVDSFRFRNFTVSSLTGRGSQIDINYNLHKEAGVASYSLMQALPKLGGLNIYPLAGVGLAFANNALEDDGSTDSGFSVPGVLGVVGMYAKYSVSDKIWLNYNPTWSVGLAGSDLFMDHGFENNENVLAHEFIFSYQFTPRFNVRYFSNWSENIDFADGDQRIEFNYQF